MKTKVAVIYGGRSGEHEISLRSAEAILAALDPKRYEVSKYFISQDGHWDPAPLLPVPGAAGVDVVFPVLHGTFGEDGTLQGLLELADVAYVGPGVMASAVCMDKDMMKRVLRDRGIPVVEYVTLHRHAIDLKAVTGRFDYPVFIKPANLGSSVGISKARDFEQLKAGVAEAARYDTKIIVERAIVGQELECAVMGNEHPLASTPCEILPSRDFYDYEDKYLLNRAQTRLPANITPEETLHLKRQAVEAYQAAGCEGMARVDFLLERSSGLLFVNEINTIPGFTSISMFPKMFEHDGIGFAALVEKLIDLALKRHERKKNTRFTR